VLSTCFVENALKDQGLFSVSAKDGRDFSDLSGTASKRVNIARVSFFVPFVG